MKKQLILRTILGFPVGVCTCNLILLIISFCFSEYCIAAPSCISLFGTELRAAAVQFVLSGIIGAVFGGGSLIWEVESWSLLRATVTHFCLTAGVYLPTSYLLGWTTLDWKGQVAYLLIFIFIYVCIWVSQYYAYKRKIQKINQALHQ